jgi:hypothetical protein
MMENQLMQALSIKNNVLALWTRSEYNGRYIIYYKKEKKSLKVWVGWIILFARGLGLSNHCCQILSKPHCRAQEHHMDASESLNATLTLIPILGTRCIDRFRFYSVRTTGLRHDVEQKALNCLCWARWGILQCANIVLYIKHKQHFSPYHLALNTLQRLENKSVLVTQCIYIF